MAIAPTGAIYKALSFDNTSSRNYGVYITGEAVYNAPERDVEMITIPGRNGAFALDNGRFQNITVSYPAGIFADTEADFAQAVSDFRNFLCSKTGYCRLTDEYNPNEYRMAVYKSGLEVDPAQLRAGEFKIIFECKPQRFLTSGETKISIATSGDTITNPTLFESSPLVEVDGYGDVDINGYTIEIQNQQIGPVSLWDQTVYGKRYGRYSYTRTIASGILDTGDSFTLAPLNYTMYASVTSSQTISNVSITSSHSGLTGVSVSSRYEGNSNEVYFFTDVAFPTIGFSYGTADSKSDTATFTYSYYVNGVPVSGTTLNRVVTVAYDGSSTVTFTFDYSSTTYPYTSGIIPSCSGVSTIIIGGYNLFLDCDLGEAYTIENGEIVSLNAYIDLGSELPRLSPGSNTITFDNTFTKMDITPRWWKL